MKTFFFFIFILNFNYLFSQQIINVAAKTPEKKIITDSLELPATAYANEKVQITTVVSEKIKRILFEEGTFVKKNQTLLELIDNQEQAIKKQIVAELDEANLNYERAKKLSAKGNISQTNLDNRLMIKNKLTARLEEINAKIEDLKITAPFSGLTGIRNFSEGSLLMPGDIVTELYDINKLKILAKVPEIFISKISRKTSFSLTSSINKDYKIDGKVSIIDPLIDDETRTFKIIGVIKNANNILKPGQMVNLKFEFDKRESLFVRENSVFNQDDISYLYLVNKGNNIEKKRVKLGARKNGLVEILDGLNSSDLVVFEGINKVKEGSIVKIK